ncbi:MAG: DsbA family protein [Candidatus Paceibacterota bacterium]
MEPTPQSSSPAIPIAIVIGFGLIALAIYFSGMGSNNSNPTTGTLPPPTAQKEVSKIRPVDETDYIRGNPNASILIVEYSDYDCPFCKNFHETMSRVMDDYGITGKVAWVYRQFPIAQLHPNAERISQAALCVGELGGNDAFWEFSDLVFQERNLNEPTNISKLPEYAEKVGVTKDALISCLDSGRHAKTVSDSIAEGAGAGIQGTPQSFVIVGNQMAAIEGAQPYAVVKQTIDNLIGQLESAGTNTETN